MTLHNTQQCYIYNCPLLGVCSFIITLTARESIPATTNQTGTQETLPTNLTTFPDTSSSQEVILTYHLTVVGSAKPSQTTNITTKEATTASGLTAPITTEHVSSNSTEFNNGTTEMSSVTATQLSPTTTVQVTKDGISALTTEMGTSAQNSTQHSTLKPTEKSQTLSPGMFKMTICLCVHFAYFFIMKLSSVSLFFSLCLPKGKLILIQENMTWIEAMGYCREHHIDLVHITTKDIQEKVAKKAEKATSPHVWLGLRYTCNFNFWFWTSSTAGCYWNWAPGQGSEGKYDCGVTGAIEATGRQQWVGLSETEKLNFICYACAG